MRHPHLMHTSFCGTISPIIAGGRLDVEDIPGDGKIRRLIYAILPFISGICESMRFLRETSLFILL